MLFVYYTRVKTCYVAIFIVYHRLQYMQLLNTMPANVELTLVVMLLTKYLRSL